MKCIANMLVSGWLGKLTAAYFPYCHICQRAERIRSSFLGKLFKCNIWPVSHWLEHEVDEAKALGKSPEAVLLKVVSATVSQNPIKFSLNLTLFIVLPV